MCNKAKKGNKKSCGEKEFNFVNACPPLAVVVVVVAVVALLAEVFLQAMRIVSLEKYFFLGVRFGNKFVEVEM